MSQVVQRRYLSTPTSNSSNFEYDIFLCHNKADKPWVHQLAQMIETEEYQGRTLRAFFDDWDVKPGENIVLRLEDAMKKSRYVGVILSPQMLTAEWPNMEWTMAVYSDPSGRRGYVIPIWRGGCEIPPSLKIRNVLYCRNEEEFKKSYAKLIALLKGQGMPRGGQGSRKPTQDADSGVAKDQFPFEYADDVQEQLAGNLFPVIKLPDKVSTGPTLITDYMDIYEHLNQTVTGVHPTFLLRNNRIFTFWNLQDNTCPFKPLISANVLEQNNTSDWLTDGTDKSNWLIEMLNRALKNHFWGLGLKYDKEHGRFYFRPDNGGDRTVTWHTGQKRATRTVVKKYKKGNRGEQFWAHQSVSARFVVLDKEIFLELNPGWTFTKDGINLLPPNEITSLSSKWMHDEYNPSVFYHIRFWSFILANGKNKITISLGNNNLEVDITPAVVEPPVGIDDDILPIEKVFEVAEKEIPPPDLLLEENNE